MPALRSRFVVLLLLLSGGLILMAIWLWRQAQEPNNESVFAQSSDFRPWVERIRRDKVLPMGYYPWYFPFSYHNIAHQGGQSVQIGPAMGFSVDASRLIGEAVGRELGIEGLTVQMVPMPLAELPDLPPPALANREVAIECTATPAAPSTNPATIHSAPYFVSGVHALSKVDHFVRQVEALRGKSILVREGAMSQWVEQHLNEKQGLAVGITPYPVIQYATVLLEDRQGIAVVGDALALLNLPFALLPESLRRYAVAGEFGEVGYGCTAMKGEEALIEVVNRAIAQVLTTELYQRHYYRWFILPTPEKAITLNYPMPQGLQTLIQKSGGTINRQFAGLDVPYSPPPIEVHELPSAPSSPLK